MSWDIYAMRLPPGVNLMDLPDDHRPEVFGSRQEVMEAVQASAPFADVSDPSWLDVAGQDLVVEVNVGEAEAVESLMFHVRSGAGAVPFVLDVCQRLGIEAWDISEGQPLRADSGAESQSRWESYRDAVVGQPSAPARRTRWWNRRRRK